jgi:hypothetical protein
MTKKEMVPPGTGRHQEGKKELVSNKKKIVGIKRRLESFQPLSYINNTKQCCLKNRISGTDS